MGAIRTWADKVEDALRSSGGLPALLSHHGLIGESREQQLLEALKKFLPLTLVLGRGQILDKDGNRSRELDIVVARGDTIRLPLSEGTYAFPFESVLGVVEVKTRLAPKTMVEAFSVFRSVLDLGFIVTLDDSDPRDEKRRQSGDWLTEDELKAMFPVSLRPATYLYAFQASLPRDAEEFGALILASAEVAGLSFDALPSVIAAPGWVAIRNDRSLIPEDVYAGPWLLAYRTEDHPLYWILAHLLFRITLFLGGSSTHMPKARYHIENHLDQLPQDRWNLVLDPRAL